MDQINAYQAKFYAHELSRSYASDDVGKLAGLLFDAQVEPKPHQIDAALFALRESTSPGVILADEVGLGKTIEAGIVLCQRWAERKRRILIVCPSSLRQQWKQELAEKFALPAILIDASTKQHLETAYANANEILICSYEFLLRNSSLLMRQWDVLVADEAHKLRSYWTGKAKIAAAFAEVCEHANQSILLTATPLQNRLEELYGLVSVFDPTLFHSLEGFKERYINSEDPYGLDELTERIARIAKRTLRKDTNKYVRFTERMPLTFGFMPSDAEIKLYELVNAYLQRPTLYAFAQSQRHLSALILRKRLGSSTYAVASTLENIAERLSAEIAEGKVRDGRGALVDDGDFNSDEREATSSGMLDIRMIAPEQVEKMRAEVEDLKEYARLARSITVNQKAVKLIEALHQGFERLREVGAPQKAIIFTDSSKTQDYIARTLAEAGWAGDIVCFNGTNDSLEATAIYKRWLQQNQNSDVITGIQAADRRKALVDEFRERASIMIATEAAAEGINLQFCSMLVNYDLPWNPQRVEQRIGRCHRFGQKHNVIVVNFSNQGNIAEERILELLTEKFNLFHSVFGSSDEVLGAIEDGFDFEKRISEILNRCKTSAEIEAAFAKLEETFEQQISSEMKQVKAKVFDHLDPAVRDKLRSYDEHTEVMLNSFERLFLAVSQYALTGYAQFNASGRYFELLQAPSNGIKTGSYHFKTNPLPNSTQHRFNSDLGQWIIDSCLKAATPPAELEFSYSTSERSHASLRPLIGETGILRVEKLTCHSFAGTRPIEETYLVSAAVTDSGLPLDDEQIQHLLDLTSVQETPASFSVPAIIFDALKLKREHLREEAENRSSGFFFEQTSVLDSKIHDHRAAHDAKMRELEHKRAKIAAAQQKAVTPADRVKLLKDARRYARLIAEEEDRYQLERNRLMTANDEYLELLEENLESESFHDEVFTVRWRISE